MSTQTNKAVRNLFRTFLRLTNDVEQAAASSGTKPSVASLLERHAKGSGVGKQFMTIADIRSHVRERFRQETSNEKLKERLSQGIAGIRQMESLLKDLQSNTQHTQSTLSLGSSTIDDSWVEPYVEKVKWLHSLDDEYEHGSIQGDQRKAQNLVELPMFPLTGAFFQPNHPLELFTSYSYWEFPTPGAEIMLKIFEPRYRELYNDLLSQPSNRRFVVPFAHPYVPAKYAEYGLLYQITEWQEIADETNGVFQYVCQHVVTYPVKLHRVLNPRAYHTQDTYLRVKGEIEMDDVELDASARKTIGKALDEHVEASVASKCRNALFTEGIWGFIRSWNTSIQQRLLQIELQIAALVKLELQNCAKDPPSEKVKGIVEKVQNNRREELLGLKLDLALSIPRVLETQNSSDRLQVILDLICSSKRK